MSRIIPCLDVQQGRVVKGVNFLDLRDAGDPSEQARLYDEQGADELVFLDITASHEQRSALLEVVRAVAEEVFIPLTVGGGIRNPQDIQDLLSAGADKVSINSAAIEDPTLLASAARDFGSQCITLALDARRDSENLQSGFSVFSHGGRRATGLDAVVWARQAESLGAGEILATSMDCDGTQKGFDLPLLEQLSAAVSLPIIASGGAGSKEHFAAALRIPRVTGLLAASLFHFGTLTIPDLKRFLQQQGFSIRLPCARKSPNRRILCPPSI